MTEQDPNPQSRRLGEIARYFLTLGFTAFGGPAAHIAMMERDLVHRRGWLTRQHFLDLIAAINFIPGPNSTELAIAIGRLRGGFRGLVIAGVCFITPAVLIILPIAWLYVNYHQQPQFAGAFRGISAVIVGIVAAAVLRLAKSATQTPATIFIALGAAAGEVFSHLHRWPWGDISILAIAGIIGAWRSSPAQPRKLFSLAWSVPAILAAGAMGRIGGPLVMTLLFLKIGATLFGSGYVLVTYLQTSLVDQQRWLTQRQVVDAVAVGQLTPGPLLTTATFVGFVLGHDRFGGGLGMEITCALLATAAIFLPAFALIAVFGSSLERLRSRPSARGALDAMNAAVVGLIAVTCVFIAEPILHPPRWWLCAGLILAPLLADSLKIHVAWLILVAAVVGITLM